MSPMLRFSNLMKIMIFSSCIISGLVLKQELAEASTRMPNEKEIAKIKLVTRQSIERLKKNGLYSYIRDYRGKRDKEQASSFQYAWSRVNPGISQFLGVWRGYEQVISIYPSLQKNKVCVASSDEEGNTTIQTGYASRGIIRTNHKKALFIEGGYLGIAIVRNNKVEQGFEIPLKPPYPLTRGKNTLSAYGCTNKLPKQVLSQSRKVKYSKCRNNKSFCFRKGDFGPYILNLAEDLRKAGYYKGSRTKYFSTSLENALKRFQKDHRHVKNNSSFKLLSIDGILGEKTIGRLCQRVYRGCGPDAICYTGSPIPITRCFKKYGYR